MDDGAELVHQAGGGERDLAVVQVDVQQAALRARVRGRLGLVDGGEEAVAMQHAGEHEAAEAGADDGDAG